MKWDEPMWEKKRQELAATPAPYPDFPFPGHIANDGLYWLWQEFEDAADAKKPLIAKDLLDRTEPPATNPRQFAGSNFWRKRSSLPSSQDRSCVLMLRNVFGRTPHWIAKFGPQRPWKHANWSKTLTSSIRQAGRFAAPPSAKKEEYRRALRWAEAAVKNKPKNPNFVNTLGVVQYRNGLYRDAITTLMRSHEAFGTARMVLNHLTWHSSRWPTSPWGNQKRPANT